MAQIIITIKIMPESPDINLNKLEDKIKKEIENFGGEVGKVETENIAFGIKALKMIFVADEKVGSTDKLEESIMGLEGIGNVEVIDVRRAIG